ncbi:hypothetical protein Tco_0020309 [Tanacetum coccineum]
MEGYSIQLISSLKARNYFWVKMQQGQYPTWVSTWLMLRVCGVSGFGIGEVVLSTFDVLQRFGFFSQMGFTLILATLDGLDECLLGDVIGGDDCDDDERGLVIPNSIKKLLFQQTARVESSGDEESLGEDASKQGRIDAIDVDEEITLVSVHNMNVSAGEEVAEEVVKVINTTKLIIDAAQVSAAGDKVSTASVATTFSAATITTATTITIDDNTLAQALKEMKSIKPKKKGIVIQELEPIKKKDQILVDEETALNLQAEFDEEARLAREKAEKEREANIALIET